MKPNPRDLDLKTTWIYTIWGCFNTSSLSFSDQLFFEKNIFENFLYILLCKISFPNSGSTTPNCLPEDASTQVWAFLAKWFLRWRFLKVFFHKFLFKNSTRTLQPGILNWNNLNLHYPRMVRHKFELFWPNDYEKRILKIFSVYKIFLCKNLLPHCGPTLTMGP